MNKKRIYRALNIKSVGDVGPMASGIRGSRAAIGVDVAKEIFFAVVMAESREVLLTVKWKHPQETPEFIDWVCEWRRNGVEVEVAMEPSGTYGDAVRGRLLDSGFPVFRVSPKRSHDAAELYDGVPSLHDAKSAAIVAMLHLDKRSEAWPMPSDGERGLRAAVELMTVYDKQFQRNSNRLEALLARYWPELTGHLDLTSATLLELLSAYGGPGAVAEDEDGATELMRRVAHYNSTSEKVQSVLASARTTLGVKQIEQERRLVMMVAVEARRNQQLAHNQSMQLEQMTKDQPGAQAMAPAVGAVTAAVLVAALGDPRRYSGAKVYLKAAGLNLRERSSGKHQGELHITKRGPGSARKYLYLAALRLIYRNEVVRAWYARKVERDGGKKKRRAVVAIMRKLAAALWHVSHGNTFQAERLFDVRRLGLPCAVMAAPQGGAAM